MFIEQLILFKNNFVEFYCGSFFDIQAAIYLKTFVTSFGCFSVNLIDFNLELVDFRLFYQLNTISEKLESFFNILFIGSSIRLEAPVLMLD